VTAAWLTHLERTPGVVARAHQWKQSKQTRRLLDIGRALLPADRSKRKPITTMIVGVPNSGKSTVLNTLAGRSLAKTGNIPAVTKRQQRIELTHNLVLMDTPGFLWPRLEPPECGYRLAVTGAVSDAVIDFHDVACFAGRCLLERYPDALRARYKLKSLPADEHALLTVIAGKRGCLGRGGVVNLQKVSELLIREVRQGLVGRVSLETPDDCRPPEAPPAPA
jgi:ribosome biogenesis GTPase A